MKAFIVAVFIAASSTSAANASFLESVTGIKIETSTPAERGSISAASYSDTRIVHADGSITDVHTDNLGTWAENSAGGSYDHGGSTGRDHHEVVREHFSPEHGDHIVDHADHTAEHEGGFEEHADHDSPHGK